MKFLIVFFSLFSSVAFASVSVKVNGMVCGFCAQGIEKKLKETKKVDNVVVDLDKKLVSFKELKGEKLTDKEIKTLLEKAGYEAVEIIRQ
jgi:mercuric ion binding protein